MIPAEDNEPGVSRSFTETGRFNYCAQYAEDHGNEVSRAS
jgi:hypothetical protein